MTKYPVIIAILLKMTLFHSLNAFAFHWPMFLPAITGVKECSKDDPSGCNNVKKCDDIGLYWYSYKCNTNKHPNQEEVEKLAGAWIFSYKYYWQREERYFYDINRVNRWPPTEYQTGWEQEWEEWKNAYIIYGFNEDGREISALYTTMKIPYNNTDAYYYAGDYSNGSPYIGKYYVFKLLSDQKLSGVFYNYANENWQQNPFPMKGERILE
jgi:hypothetical protein